MKTAIGIHGACGRTGRRIVDLAHADPDITLAAALDAPNHPLLGRDIGEIAGADALVDGEIALAVNDLDQHGSDGQVRKVAIQVEMWVDEGTGEKRALYARGEVRDDDAANILGA